MKQGRTLPDLAKELERQQSAKRDFLAPAGQLAVVSNGHTDLIVGERFALNDIAHSQLAEYLGVPKPFYDRLRNETLSLRVRPPLVPARARSGYGEPGRPLAPEQLTLCDDAPLFDVIMNRLLEGKGAEERFVRTLDGKARALLSPTFNPDLDHFDVFQVAAVALQRAGLGSENVLSCEVTERRLYLKVVSPRLQADVRPSTNLHSHHGGHAFLKEPQTVQAGFVLSNSEVGLGSLSIQQTVYKLLCTNLWIREEAYRQRHVGRALTADDEGTVYRSDTREADAKAKLLKIRDHVSDALDETRFRHLVAQMQESTEVKLEGKLTQIVELTGRKYGFNAGEKENVLQNLIEGADLSLWGLTNAVTQTAQTASSYDRATELEAVGGRLLSLPAAEVKEIVRAE